MRKFIMAGAALLAMTAVPAAAQKSSALASPAPVSPTPESPAQESSAPARGTESERSEIARILAADNLDNSNMEPAQVAATIRAIPRGGAPTDFWEAYRAHVGAWDKLGQAVTLAEAALEAARAERGDADTLKRAAAALIEAEAAVESTFTEVTEIATRYGVPIPAVPEPVDLRDTV